MTPFVTLAETASAFDASAALTLLSSIIKWILDTIKGEPVLAAAFVVGVLVPAGFAVVGRIKRTSKQYQGGGYRFATALFY